MGIVSDLLNAQRRPASQSRRLTEAVDAALDAPILNPDISAAEAVDAAEAAFRHTTREINEERVSRPAAPETHVSSFGDDAREDLGFDDAELATESNLSSDDHFLPGGSLESDAGEVSDPGVDDAQAPPLGHPAAGSYAYGRYYSPEQSAADDAPAESENFDETEGDGSTAEEDFDETDELEEFPAEEEASVADPHGEDVTAPPANPADAATDPRIPIPHFEPSPLDNFVELAPGFVAPAAAVPPAAPGNKPAPVPSAQSTAPANDPFDDLEPDEELSFAGRMRQSTGSAMSRLRGGEGSRARWLLAGAAAVLAIVLVAIFSLSGGRGEAPVPAGTVAAPPAQTENPSAAPTAAPLVPKFVSASCVGDTDAVSLFAGEKSRAWVCGRSNGLDGSVLNITFNAPVVVTEITLVPGFNYVAPDGRDEWDRHRQVTGVTWRMGGQSFPQTINPTRTGTTMKFPSVITQEMSMTITASTRPAKGAGSGGIGKPSSDNSADVDETTAISSIVITGYPVDPGS